MKKCPKCNRELLLQEFNKKRNGLQPWCKECNRIKSRQYYAANKEAHIKVINKNRKIRILENQKRIFDFLLEHPCIDCGFSDPRGLTFDHLRDKVDDVCGMLSSCSWTTVINEINKCVVRCATCHNIKTAIDFNYYTHRLMMLHEQSG